MAITDKEKGVWGLDQVYNKINQGSIWEYSGVKGLWSWGYNTKGIQGQNSTTQYYSSPTQVGSEAFVHISKGYVEARHYVAVNSSGEMWSWGNGEYGQLGQNTNADSSGGDGFSSPAQIGSDTTWNHGSHGMNASLAVKTDGTLWIWGQNYAGRLGQNNETTYSSPVQIPGTTWDTGYGSLFLSQRCGAAIRTDGTYWTWGSNSYGILGLNQAHTLGGTGNVRYSSPVQVPGTTWKQIDIAPQNRAAAVKTDGTLWSWGYGEYGANGVNNRTTYSSPTQIPGTTWAAVAQSNKATLATKTDGTLWTWGYNEFGQLGQNSGENAHKSSPVQVPGTTWTTNPALLNGEDRFMFAAKTDGTIWAWGYNNQGGLGQNNRTSYSSPIQVGSGSWDPTSLSGNVYAGSFTGQL